MNLPFKLLIGGEWIATDRQDPVMNPFNGTEIAKVALGNEEVINQAIAAAVTAFEETKKQAAFKRVELLNKVTKGLEARRADFVETIVAEAGKPIASAEAEVDRAILTFTCAAEEARRWNGESGKVLPLDGLPVGEGHFGVTRRFPIGVISAITPFNFPLNLVAHKVAPCLATGNTMVVKPAPKTPLSALLLGEVLTEAGMPPGQINFITCGNEHASRLVTDWRVAMVSFTGSPAVGWKLKEMAGKKKICLELGGNAGVIVHADANWEAAIPAIATGSFAYAGQTCISVQRIVVHESIYEPFKTAFANYVKEKVKAGDPADRATVIGPMISSDAAQKTRARISSALAAGAKLVCGDLNGESPVMQPIVLEDVPSNHEVCTCELFAPVVTLHKYQEFDEALRFINDSDFGLQAGVFTQDIRLAFRAYETLDVGGVLINQIPTWRVETMPYGGVKDSGFGREGLRYAMEDMTELKSLIIRTG